jgi:hypothetical protein
MNLTTSILSILAVTALVGCKSQIVMDPVPTEHLYTPDIANQVCIEYALADSTKITFSYVATHKLLAGGPCDHMRGFTNVGFKKVQNWVRDIIQYN